jgi:Cutinase
VNKDAQVSRARQFRNIGFAGAVTVVLFGTAVSVARLFPKGSESVRLDGTSVECREVVVVGARESGSPPGTQGDFGFTGVEALSAMASQLKSRRSISSVGLKYPARSTGAILDDSNAYFDGVDQGVVKLVNVTEQISGLCRSWIVLIGYSQGALVIRKALPRMSSLTRSRIAGVALFGDPARSPEDGTVRIGGRAAGKEGLYESVVDATAAVPSLAGPALSFCNEGDAICAAEPGNLLGMALEASVVGGNSTPHGQYRFDGSTQRAGVTLADQLLTLPKRPG